MDTMADEIITDALEELRRALQRLPDEELETIISLGAFPTEPLVFLEQRSLWHALVALIAAELDRRER
jgi:hypothetical protein